MGMHNRYKKGWCLLNIRPKHVQIDKIGHNGQCFQASKINMFAMCRCLLDLMQLTKFVKYKTTRVRTSPVYGKSSPIVKLGATPTQFSKTLVNKDVNKYLKIIYNLEQMHQVKDLGNFKSILFYTQFHCDILDLVFSYIYGYKNQCTQSF